MTTLSSFADELDELVRDGRHIRVGSRDFEKPHADLDDLLHRLDDLAGRLRTGTVTPSTRRALPGQRTATNARRSRRR